MTDLDLSVLSGELEPYRARLETLLELERRVEAAAPAEVRMWPADRWRIANERQKESISRLLDMVREKTAETRELNRELAKARGLDGPGSDTGESTSVDG